MRRKSWNRDANRYDEKMTIQTGIDGYRGIAESASGRDGTALYQGQLGPYWSDFSKCPGCDGKGVVGTTACPRCVRKDGIRWEAVWSHKTPPAAAMIGIVRHGFPEPVWAVALWTEYVQTDKDGNPAKFWKQMPASQLAKCAEALGLRKAFPQALSGIYTHEEMGQADREDGGRQVAPPPKVYETQVQAVAPLPALPAAKPTGPVQPIEPGTEVKNFTDLPADTKSVVGKSKYKLMRRLGVKINGKKLEWAGAPQSDDKSPEEYVASHLEAAVGHKDSWYIRSIKQALEFCNSIELYIKRLDEYTQGTGTESAEEAPPPEDTQGAGQ
jgi:hypothetical protein